MAPGAAPGGDVARIFPGLPWRRFHRRFQFCFPRRSLAQFYGFIHSRRRGGAAEGLRAVERLRHYKTMALLKIARMGHPVLRGRAAPVDDPAAPEIRRLAQDMLETMRDAPGVGLAAPQVYAPLRMVVARAPADRSGGGEEPESVFINPEITLLDDADALGWEGCLSVPGLRGIVPRHRRIGLTALDLNGKTIEREISGFFARVIQHETDHLNGVLYLERMTDLQMLAFEGEARHIEQSLRDAQA